MSTMFYSGLFSFEFVKKQYVSELTIKNQYVSELTNKNQYVSEFTNKNQYVSELTIVFLNNTFSRTKWIDN